MESDVEREREKTERERERELERKTDIFDTKRGKNSPALQAISHGKKGRESLIHFFKWSLGKRRYLKSPLKGANGQ